MSQTAGYAVEIFLDSDIVNEVHKAREFLGEFIGSQFDTSPRITLFSSSFKPSAEVEKAVEAFIEANKEAFSISYSLDDHNDKGLLYLMPTPSGLVKLKQLRSQLFEALISEGLEIGEEDDEAYDSWVPYCGVARDVPEDMMNEALSVLKEKMDLPVTGDAIRLELVEFTPNPIPDPKYEFWNRFGNMKTKRKPVFSFTLEDWLELS